MLKTTSLLILQKALNHALALDESMPMKLHALEGKVLEMVISPLQVRFFICFASHELQLKAHVEGHVDATIHSSPLGLIRLSLLPASKVRSLFNDKIRVSGDVTLGQQVKALFDEIDIDWEGHLARFTGDVIAYQLGSLVRQGMAKKREVSASFRQDLTTYLQDEVRLFPASEEILDFYHDVDELSLSVERLSARVKQLLEPTK
ncbi:MAG: SCP2 sterol-binding domain-containing protein [Legionellales bacterium]|nr:SCP2 sterol-binding domain-containing protein [Legionellales bacterium]